MTSAISEYDTIPKLMITTHGKWNVSKKFSKGHPTFKLPYNVQIMFATGMGVVNYLDQTIPNMINKEYKKNNHYGIRKIKKLKKDLKSYDLNGCCDALSCKINRRNSGHIIRDVLNYEKNDSDSSNRRIATEFLDHTDNPYKITSKQKGADMPIKTYEIARSEFGKELDGTRNRNIINRNDNRIILYIPGHEPIDILYNWDTTNMNEPFITVKLKNDAIKITLITLLERVKQICLELGVTLTDLDIIDLSCNVTLDDDNQKAPVNEIERETYIVELREKVFGDDEVISSSSSESINGIEVGSNSMIPLELLDNRSHNKKNTKKRARKKTKSSNKKSRRSYITSEL